MIILVKLRLSLDGLGEYPHLKGYGLYDRLSPVYRYKACVSLVTGMFGKKLPNISSLIEATGMG